MQCLLCNRQLKKRLTIHDLLWADEIRWPRVCPECWAEFTSIQGPTCPVCGRPQSKEDICCECQYWRTRYPWKLRHTALYCYNDAMKDYMHRYKFNGDYRLRLVFNSLLTAAVSSQKVDSVVPIPITEETKSTRGFNQVEGFLTGIKLQHCLTTRVQQKLAQSKKNRHERLQTPQPFRLDNTDHLTGQRVLLVDDVYTTGRTLYHAAQLIYDAGAANVISISLAR